MELRMLMIETFQSNRSANEIVIIPSLSSSASEILYTFSRF